MIKWLKMIVSIVRIVVPSEKRTEILETLSWYLGPVCHQAGCLSCRAYQGLDDENEIILVEKWTSQAYLNRHLCSNDYAKLLTLMDLSKETPEVNFITVSNMAGIELIKKVREVGE
jgi:quinol monooxygenase YgiN